MCSIGKRVRAARQECGYTMKQLHDLTGLSTGNISDIENDRNVPSVSSLIPLSKALNRSLDWLLTGESLDTRNIEPSETDNSSALSQDEWKIIAILRSLPAYAQGEIYDFAQFVFSRHSEIAGEKQSTYQTSSNANACAKSGPRGGHNPQSGIA